MTVILKATLGILELKNERKETHKTFYKHDDFSLQNAVSKKPELAIEFG